MEDWTSGYVADIGYTYGYYPELNPALARLALNAAGFAAPRVENACELGFGQGVSVNIHAAASQTRWWGTDFNPSQASFARELASAAGSGAHLFDEAFEDFCHRGDLPEMDFIALHGIWSWINDRNRTVLVDFIRRKLKVGGVLYISYNTFPGWAAHAPLRDLMVQAGESLSAPGAGTVAKIGTALAFVEKFFETQPRYLKQNPAVAERLKLIAGQDRHYVAHEYFNRDWAPMSFQKVAEHLEPAKVTFACPATLIEHVESVYFTPEQLAVIKEVKDPVLQQTLRDMAMNQQFRKDIWVKGPRRLPVAEQKDVLDNRRFIMCRPRADVKLALPNTTPEIKLSEQVYNPILDVMSDFKPHSFTDLMARTREQGMNPAKLLQAMIILAGKADVMPVQDEGEIAASRPVAHRLNARLVDLSRSEGTVQFLASPVTGSGMVVPRFQQLFLAAHVQGARTAKDIAQKAWDTINATGQRVAKNGTALNTPEENLAELRVQAEEFLPRIPAMKALDFI